MHRGERGSAEGEELALGLHKLLETSLPGIKQKGGASIMEMRNLEGRGMGKGIIAPLQGMQGEQEAPST